MEGITTIEAIMLIHSRKIRLGTSVSLSIPLGRNYDGSMASMPVKVIRGKKDGPSFFISGGIHGDELCGPAIVQGVLSHPSLEGLRGTIIAVPVVNIFGFNDKSRYLPDRRDLNRSFPGSRSGSLASQIAHVFTEEIIKNSDYGIDFHSAAIHRVNLPQIRATLDDEELSDMADNFCAPVTLNSSLRDGSMRETADSLGVKVLLFEGGEALRVDAGVTSEGVKGCLSVMASLNMIEAPDREGDDSYRAQSSYWVRSPKGGMVRLMVNLGTVLKKGQVIAEIVDLLGEKPKKVRAPSQGVLIGMSKIPLVNRGDALFHICSVLSLDVLTDVLDDLCEYVSL